jgi:putative component of toxin-antitoxin plasmid stabilization module
MDTGERVAIVQTPRDEVLLILLNGGDKSTQARDITTAKRLAKEAKDGIEGSSL